MRLKVGVSLFIFFALILNSCQSDYTKLVKSEMAKNVQNDSIFYEMEFGQSRDKFYELCWKYNKQGKFIHGSSNSYVQVMLEPQDSSMITDRIQMLFYGKFNSDKIMTAMDIKFSYVAWAPWNKNLQAENLIPRVKDTLMKWYPGNEFITVKDMQVKVDGNRQILIETPNDTREVDVRIDDLRFTKGIN